MYETILNCPNCGYEHRLVADEVVADRDRLREQVSEAGEIIDGMTEWMRCVLPSQVEPGTKAERDSLLRTALRWTVERNRTPHSNTQPSRPRPAGGNAASPPSLRSFAGISRLATCRLAGKIKIQIRVWASAWHDSKNY
jgi:hypothetical protein